MPHEGPEIVGEFVGEAQRKPGRLVAVATVLATLAAATTGYLQASALREHAEVAMRAERLAALAINVAAGSQDQTQVQIDRYNTLRQEQRQSSDGGRSHPLEAGCRSHREEHASDRSGAADPRPLLGKGR